MIYIQWFVFILAALTSVVGIFGAAITCLFSDYRSAGWPFAGALAATAVAFSTTPFRVVPA